MSAGRDTVALQPPHADLSTFPRKVVDKGRRWWREHGEQGPWYFAAGPAGRFNLEHPRGTLYTASSAECAARERIGRDLAAAGLVPASLVLNRYVSELEIPIDVAAAHVTHPDALRWGVVAAELCGLDDYDLTQQWARAFDDAGFTGMWVLLRFSGTNGRGLAVFGPAGPCAWPQPVTSGGLRQILADMHLAVIDPPSSKSLTIDPD